MTVRAVVFDLDGTLVDSLADIADAMNHAIGLAGLAPHGLEAYRGFVGDGVERLARRALGEARLDRVAATVAAFRARYAAHLVDRTAPYPGVVELLEALAARGVALGVLSNKPDPATREVVARLFPATPFAAVRGERPGVPRKPDPTGAREVVAALGVAPAEAALVGDTDVDVHAARGAGLRAVGALWGYRDAASLRAAGAHALAARPGEVLAALGLGP